MNETQAIAGAKRAESWLIQHERLIIVVLVLVVVAFGLNKWLNKSATDAAATAAAAQQVAVVQHNADVQVAAAIAQQTALFNQESQVREQEIASLVATVAARNTASSQKVQIVTQPKTPSQAVVDLQGTYTLAVPVTVTADGADVPTADLQQFTVAKIEGDTAKADLIDTTTELTKVQAGLSSSNSLVTALQNQVTGLNTEIQVNETACTTEIASVKASARKSKWNWFKGGVVVGFIAGVITGHYIP